MVCACHCIYAQDVTLQSKAFDVLMNNQNLNNEIQEFFKKDIKKGQWTIQSQTKTSFISILPFQDDLEQHINELGFQLDSLSSIESRRRLSFQQKDIEASAPKSNKDSPNLFVQLSNPIGNLLAMEINNLEISPHDKIKMGKGLRVLILFDNNQNVYKIFTKKLSYN